MASRRRTSTSSRIAFFAFQDIITAVSGILTLIVLMQAIDLASDPSPSGGSAHAEEEKRLAQLLATQAQLEAEARELQEAVLATGAVRDTQLLESEVRALRENCAATTRRLAETQAEADRRDAASREMDVRLGLTDLRDRMDQAQKDAASAAVREQSARRRLQELAELVKKAQSRLLRIKAREGQTWLVPDRDATTLEPVLVTVSGDGAVIERFDRPAERVKLAAATAATGFADYLDHLRPTAQYVVFLIRPSGIAQYESLSALARKQGFEIGFDPVGETRVVHFANPAEPDEPAPVSPPASTAPSGPAPATSVPGKAGPASPPPSVAVTNAPTSKPPPPPPAPEPEQSESWWHRLLRALGIVKS